MLRHRTEYIKTCIAHTVHPQTMKIKKNDAIPGGSIVSSMS